jgi:hypothetical protein
MAAAIRSWLARAPVDAVAQDDSPLMQTLERRRLVARIAGVFEEVLASPWSTAADAELELASR